MGKLIKIVVLLGILVAAVAIYFHYAKSGDDKTAGALPVQKKEVPKGGIQVQEKYGFAPTGE